MKPITFIDTEVEPISGRILDIGGIKHDGSSFHSLSHPNFVKFLKGTDFICGHNIFNHDFKYIQGDLTAAGLTEHRIIDTLFLSPLLFPLKPYHRLLKDDKLQTEEINNPLNDSIKARDLFFDEVTAFRRTDIELQQIYYGLLGEKKEFQSFFKFVGFNTLSADLGILIHQKFHPHICENAGINRIALEHPMELAYCLALINADNRESITPRWVTRNFPDVQRIMFLLRSKPCLKGCAYCNQALDIHVGLKRFFGYDSYRTFAGEPLQAKATQAAIDNKSLLAIFPTGGGKSITFQVPALMSGESCKGLTVVISPLQSLMKDQVDNLEEMGITEAVTINALLDPIERAKSIERVENGSASILYISPESLRSKTIENMLLGRNVVRFVIDEAHCFSSWGQTFRVDYLYIGNLIRSLQEQKKLVDGIPVSCFTATAKPQVIDDIKSYFEEKLGLELEVFSSKETRNNLRYAVFQRNTDAEKYSMVRELLQERNCPTIIYVSRTKKAYELAQRLTDDGFEARPYHGRMESREKTGNQDAFIKGQVRIMVATSAFGMGVDKKDVGMVIHYEVSDSLENYVQEAGRAGRDESIYADCFVLFNDDDLGKHFILLNQTKISIREIQQIWKAIKELSRFRSTICQSALDIARKAGWDGPVSDLETRVRTAVTALEEAGYLKRTHNVPRVYADGILARNAQDAIDRINDSHMFDERQKVQAARIMKKLISSRSRQWEGEEFPEARIDYIADHLGIAVDEVIGVVQLLRIEGILADSKDLTVYLSRKENVNQSLKVIKSFNQIEICLASLLANRKGIYNIKKLNESVEESGCASVTPAKIKNLLNIWTIKQWIVKRNNQNQIGVDCTHDKKVLNELITKRNELAQFILEYLFEKDRGYPSHGDEIPVEFSVLELTQQAETRSALFNRKVPFEEIEDALFYLSRIGALKIEGGFLVTYQRMTIERVEKDNRIQYKKNDYKKLEHFYENKTQQIHIVGEYARKMLESYKAALQFVDDYFRLNYGSFLNKYFKGNREEINRNMTPAKFRQLFGELSPTQLEIINDTESQYIVVAAGPGSGKTRILVHKLASLLLMEDVKHEQMLMVTFSRSAVTEFKKRLLKLIGPAAHFVEIKTFHSYCFDLLGRVGTLEKSEGVITEALKRIKAGEVEPSRITKMVLVIDEAQDMDADEFELIKALMEHNEEMRLIAVGDDDQNIFEFRGSSSDYLKIMLNDIGAVKHELVENYRSKSNLVDYSNQFVTKLPRRIKENPIIAAQKDNGLIRVVRYRSKNLVTPLVDDILSAELTGTTCVLTKTNEEALQIASLLVENGLNAKLIQTNDGFNLYNLQEIRFFLSKLGLGDDSYTIGNDLWVTAKREFKKRFSGSANFDIVVNMVKNFEVISTPIRYKSDLEIFIRESKLEDFYQGNQDTIFVSTIHKAKGREFDNVFLMLNQFNCSTDEGKRQLYVAMTRAKNNLTIHYNGNCLDGIKTENLRIAHEYKEYASPAKLCIPLSHRDVWLDHFISRQNAIESLQSGDTLSFDGEYCCNAKGERILKTSKQAANQIKSLRLRNYRPTHAKIRFMVYWQKEDSEQEIMIVLPEVYFERAQEIEAEVSAERFV